MLKPLQPQSTSPEERNRYRKDMVAFFADPRQWGWVESECAKPVPVPCEGCEKPTYPEHGKPMHLDDGSDAGAGCNRTAKSPEPPPVTEGKKGRK
jgi:hypothetical protein